MLTGRPYRLTEFIFWTRRTIYVLILVSAIPAILYKAGITWLLLPWSIILLLGATVALSAGFKAVQTYGRLQEAQQAWASIVSSSRIWAGLCRDLVDDPVRVRDLVHRHFAWLAALRHQLRGVLAWENVNKAYSAEYKRLYHVQEHEESLESELARYVGPDDAAQILTSTSKALRALDLQGREVRRLLDDNVLTATSAATLQNVLRDFLQQQGQVERIKNFPYPRQYAFINTLFVRILCVLLPFGITGEFAQLDGLVEGWASGNMVWLGVPLSVLISWMYLSLDQVGESSENPFEGGANDVPITQLSKEIEGDLRGMIDEGDMPFRMATENGIAM